MKTKQCPKCKEVKDFSEFYKSHSQKHNLQTYCKDCIKIYQKSEKGKAAQRKYKKTKKGKVSTKRYHQTKKGKIAQKATHKRYTQNANGKAARKRGSAKQRIKFPTRIKARSIVTRAIQLGNILHPTALKCTCGNPAKQYHHHKGYAEEHYLDVIPICAKCHYVYTKILTTDERQRQVQAHEQCTATVHLAE